MSSNQFRDVASVYAQLTNVYDSLAKLYHTYDTHHNGKDYNDVDAIRRAIDIVHKAIGRVYGALAVTTVGIHNLDIVTSVTGDLKNIRSILKYTFQNGVDYEALHRGN